VTKLKAPQVVADVEQGLVLATVEIAAAPHRVFEALVRAEDVLRWWASDDFSRATQWTADVRPGGRWRAAGLMKDGRAFNMEGEFTEVAAPHKLVFTWRTSGDVPHQTLVTYILEPIETGTRLTLRHEGFAGRVAACRQHGYGWGRVLDLVEVYLRPDSPPEHYFLFKLTPPRPTFMYDITPDEQTLMGVHGVYWSGQLAAGKIIAFGPVADPAGGWGLGVLRVTNPAEVDELIANDPVSLAKQGFRYEVFPMPRAVHL